ncbi:MAG: hypothetical protein ACC653_09235 [Gammaproteobacteria bacterium]
MKKNLAFKYMVVVIVSLFITSCDNKDENTVKPKAQYQTPDLNAITKIDFVEQEKGIEPYKVRLIVSYDYLRFDDGESSNGFILYNRRNKIIYNVNDEDKTIMEIHPKRKSVVSPIKLRNRNKKIADLTDAPTINNTVPVKYDFSTNGVVCFGIVSVKGLLPMATKALREFQQALADDSTFTLESIPADMHDACALSMNTFASTRHLKFGFPIQFWSPKGYSRSLVGFDDDFKSKEKLFILPEKYKNFTVDELRSGTMG